MSKEQMKRVATYKLDIDILTAMEEYADSQGMTKSALIERALAYYLRTHEDLKSERDSDLAYIKSKQRLRAYKNALDKKNE